MWFPLTCLLTRSTVVPTWANIFMDQVIPFAFYVCCTQYTPAVGKNKPNTCCLAPLFKLHLCNTTNPKTHRLSVYSCAKALSIWSWSKIVTLKLERKFIDQHKSKTSTNGMGRDLLVNIPVQASMLHVKSCTLFLNINFTPRCKQVNKKPIQKSPSVFKDHIRSTRCIACSSPLIL